MKGFLLEEFYPVLRVKLSIMLPLCAIAQTGFPVEVLMQLILRKLNSQNLTHYLKCFIPGEGQLKQELYFGTEFRFV